MTVRTDPGAVVRPPFAWRYAYDALGRLIRQTPPDNGTATDLAGLEWKYEASGRLEQVCQDLDGAMCGGSPDRTETDQDDLGRTTVSRAIKSGASTITTTTTYDVYGAPLTTGDGTTTVAIAYIPETGLPDTVSVGGSVTTDYAWNGDATLATRQDGGGGSTVTFGYDWAKRETSVSSSDGAYGGALTRTFRLDGLLATQSWPNGETASLAYDPARRPTTIGLTGGRSLSRAYDRTGNVTTDDRYLAGSIATPAGDGALTHAYDDLDRVIETRLDGVPIATYAYDRSSNRVTKTEDGHTTVTEFDRTDAPISQVIDAGSAAAFDHDAAGNLTVERTRTGAARTYAYDAADRLTTIDDPTGNDADLTYDPLGRIATRTVGSDVQSWSHVGTSDVAWRWSGTVTTSALVDGGGSRLGTQTAGSAGWLVFDLLGSVAAAEPAGSTTISDALRTDAWGQTIGLYPAGGSDLAVRFRGLVDLAPTADRDVAGAGSDPLYAMGARPYSPHLGTFTALDSYAGSAVDPASLNRYLYAHANPATLIDPTGHRVCEYDCQGSPSAAEVRATREGNARTPRPSDGGQPTGGGGSGTSGGTSNAGGSTPPPTFDDHWSDGPPTGALVGDVWVNLDGTARSTEDQNRLYFLCYDAQIRIQAACIAFDATNAQRDAANDPCLTDPEYCQLRNEELLLTAAFIAEVVLTGVALFTPPGDEQALVNQTIPATTSRLQQVRDRLQVIGARAVPAGCHSFAASTVIQTPDGERPIAEVDVGDEIMALDPDTGEIDSHAVTATFVHHDLTTGVVVIDGQSIGTTPGHRFLTIERGWVEAQDLRPGDHVVSIAGGSGAVASTRWDGGSALMYDLTVERVHTFAVGTGGWVVHNCADEIPLGPLGGITKLTTRRAQELIGDPHAFKREYVGKNLNHFDIALDKSSGQIILIGKDGEIVPTGVKP